LWLLEGDGCPWLSKSEGTISRRLSSVGSICETLIDVSGVPLRGGRYCHVCVPTVFSANTRPAKQEGINCMKSGSKNTIRSPNAMKSDAISASRCVVQERRVTATQQAASKRPRANASWTAQHSAMMPAGAVGEPGSSSSLSSSCSYSSSVGCNSRRSSPALGAEGLGGGLGMAPRAAVDKPAGKAMPQAWRAS